MEVKSFYGPFTFTPADVNTSRHIRNPAKPFPCQPAPSLGRRNHYQTREYLPRKESHAGDATAGDKRTYSFPEERFEYNYRNEAISGVFGRGREHH